MTRQKAEEPVALITGAGSGIGRATARLLSAAGYRLVLVGRRRERLLETGAALGTDWHAISIDIGVAENAAAAVDETLAHFGHLDVLVNNAGYAPAAPIEQKTPSMIRDIFAVNAVAAAVTIARSWPTLKARAEKTGRATIVNISSYATVDPFPGLFVYAASKASVNLMARSCHNEGSKHGIRAFAVAPGAVETEMLREFLPEDVLPSSRTLKPEDVGEVIMECVLGKRDDQSGDVILVPSP
jgi:NAD(P)-dependent dehydrogenase (short-subunit alcohol dehydrogenase family)